MNKLKDRSNFSLGYLAELIWKGMVGNFNIGKKCESLFVS